LVSSLAYPNLVGTNIIVVYVTMLLSSSALYFHYGLPSAILVSI